MKIEVLKGDKLTDDDINVFNSLIKEAFSKDEIDVRDHFGVDNVHFFMKTKGKVSAVGRYVKVDGILIDGQEWVSSVWGRSLIAVSPSFQGMGLGKTLVRHMVDYANQSHWSHVGIHGKNAHVSRDAHTSLSSFYKSCGLIIDEEIGAKFKIIENEGERTLAHTNISHSLNDPFLDKVKLSQEVILPFSW